MSPRTLLLALTVVLAASACVEKSSKPKTKPAPAPTPVAATSPDAAAPSSTHVQSLVLDASGATLLTLAGSVQGGFDAGDSGGRVLGRVRVRREGDGRVVSLRGPNGADLAEVKPDGDMRKPDGSAFGRVTLDGDAIRVIDAKGLTIAHVIGGDGVVFVRDSSGAVIGELRESGDRMALSKPDGAALGYVVGMNDRLTAALLVAPGLTSEQRALVGAWALSR